MAITVKNTQDYASTGVKVLVYGQAGAGKTTLCASLPTPIVLSAESGLLSLAGQDLAYIEIKTLQDLQDAYAWARSSQEAQGYESIALDSISEIAEVVLSAEKASNKDGRAAYGEMQDRVAKLLRSFRDLQGRHVYFSAKAEHAKDEGDRLIWQPGMPGNKLGQQISYFFDEVLPLRVEKDLTTGERYRVLQTQPDGKWIAKDRSGLLNPSGEEADLGAIIAKIMGGGGQ